MITLKILKENKLDQVYRMPINEIIYEGLWLPADYGFDLDCGSGCIYHHRCIDTAFVDRWHEVMQLCRETTRYPSILKSIKQNDFVYPLAAKVGETRDHIALVDGHNRLTVAFDLGIKYIPILIANPLQEIADLVATDSNYWFGGQIDSLFTRLDKKAAAC